ncbi:hypothetical protein [Ilumatobacter nonamiensis]|uniref:hypothetical protein n=1 Tax=Ilumatobacter nonamiensis TaxID=467093 RepID=UPI00034806BB|nr:hypothetical protein [Ilumatobacter nonamiensis]
MAQARGPAATALIVTAALLIAGCSTGEEMFTPPTLPAPSERNQSVPDSIPFTSDCDDDTLGADDEFAFPTAYLVVGGALGELCRGEPDPRLVEAWETLATIAPAEQLGDLGLFTAFEAAEEGDEITLAFVSALDAEGSLFQMSIGLDSFVADPDEALLTLAHEFSHVFTSMPTQIDRTVEAGDNCVTYDNGEGCFLADSLIFQWIEEFWGDGSIDDVDPRAETSASEGEQRCADDAGFFGPYAASDPEEDFAEAFSAYVFAVDPATPEQQERLEWLAAQPGLAEFRDRAVDAGLTPVPNRFEVCG